MIERQCNECREWKPLTICFEKDAPSKDGYRVVCKECRNKAKRDRAKGVYRGSRQFYRPDPKVEAAKIAEREIGRAWSSARIPAQPNARFGVPSIGVAA